MSTDKDTLTLLNSWRNLLVPEVRHTNTRLSQVFYTFQGLTYDGKYYISMILPIAQAGLPADMQAGVDQYGTAIESDFSAYLSTTVQALNDADGSTFTPTLAQLDTLVNSLTVAPTN